MLALLRTKRMAQQHSRGKIWVTWDCGALEQQNNLKAAVTTPKSASFIKAAALTIMAQTARVHVDVL